MGHQLAHAGDLEGHALDGLGHHLEGLARYLFQGPLHHAGAADAHVDGAFRLARAAESAGHEGIVLHRVAEHNQLGAAQSVLLLRELRRAADDAAHLGHGVHVDAGPGGAQVNAGAQPLRGGQHLGDGFDQLQIGRGGAFLHQGGIAA